MFKGKQDVRCEHADGKYRLRKIFELGRQHPEPAERYTAENDEKEGWKNAPGAPLVKISYREAVRVQLVDNDAGNQVAADDEKDIDADIAAAEGRKTGMEQDNRHHCDRP
ncbi:MAG: hypothetical protein ACI9JL_000510 [Paracoccaceae bacterium]